jgi:beta-mannanase
MMMKLLNIIAVTSLFFAGATANCSNTEYGCCSPGNNEVRYVDNSGNWGIENGNWCFMQPEGSNNQVQAQINNTSNSLVVSGNTFDSMFFGAWVGGKDVKQPTAQNIAAFQALQERHLDVVHLFVIWQYNDWNWAREYLQIAKENGSITMISWMPTPHTAQNILDGAADDYIKTFANGVKEFGDEIWLRPLHESNGDWYTWGTGKDSVNNAEDKVAGAYRHIVDIFRGLGVNNVKWIWTTNCSNSGSSTFRGSYPGDEYVDYISIDGYNWGTAQSWSSLSSFEEVFTPSYQAISQFNKPMFLAEFSSSELGGDKAGWITDMFRVLPEKFPKIVGLVWFSESKPDNEGDWALDSSPAAVEAWKKGISTYPEAHRKTSN